MARARVYIYLLTISIVLALGSSAIALEKSSKRNCAICHVMWLDDFRTDKETLIEWQPGNVLMKDTQGVVSSEEMCYSCHDGYVMDSRSVTWKYNGHRTFVKPSKNVTVPADLPLSNKDEIYCGTCHTAHGGGSNTDASISGGLSFLRKDNIDSQMCGCAIQSRRPSNGIMVIQSKQNHMIFQRFFLTPGASGQGAETELSVKHVMKFTVLRETN